MSESSGLVAWDVDDVLNSLTAAWARDAGIDRLAASPSAGNPTEYFRSLGWSREDFLSSLDLFRASRFVDLVPNALATEAMKRLSECGFLQIAVTKCPLQFGPISSQWTFANFGSWLSGYFLLPSRRASDPRGYAYREKSRIAAFMVEPVVLIDDTPANLSDLPTNCHGILYPQPWNGAQEIAMPNELVQRVIDVFDATTLDGA